MYLFINTTQREDSYVILAKAGIQKKKKILNRNALAACDFLLKKEKVKLEKLAGIIVVTGPGQFSSLRAGIATANTLGFACSILVAGVELADSMDTMLSNGIKKLSRLKKFRPVGAEYGKEPNITVNGPVTRN